MTGAGCAPPVRFAVDGAAARQLADAFRPFDAESDAAVAVLWGEGGTFRAGADLKPIGTDRGNKVAADRRWGVPAAGSVHGRRSWPRVHA